MQVSTLTREPEQCHELLNIQSWNSKPRSPLQAFTDPLLQWRRSWTEWLPIYLWQTCRCGMTKTLLCWIEGERSGTATPTNNFIEGSPLCPWSKDKKGGKLPIPRFSEGKRDEDGKAEAQGWNFPIEFKLGGDDAFPKVTWWQLLCKFIPIPVSEHSSSRLGLWQCHRYVPKEWLATCSWRVEGSLFSTATIHLLIQETGISVDHPY